MELLEVAKKLRREVKKACMDLEKQMKTINSQLRVQRGAATGGVKEKRAINEQGLTDLLNLAVEGGNYSAGEVVVVDKDSTTVVLTPSVELIKAKLNLSFDVSNVKGKITLQTINFADPKTEEVLTVTLKDVKESLKTVKEA